MWRMAKWEEMGRGSGEGGEEERREVAFTEMLIDAVNTMRNEPPTVRSDKLQTHTHTMHTHRQT